MYVATRKRLSFGRRFADPRAGYKTHREAATVGVASTGQVSRKGTVTTYNHWDGTEDANVRPMPISTRIDPRTGLIVPATLRYDEETRTWLPARKS